MMRVAAAAWRTSHTGLRGTVSWQRTGVGAGVIPATTTGKEVARERGEAGSVFFVQLAHMVLRVELDAEPRHEIELRLEEVDKLLLVPTQLFKQVARHVVLYRMAVGRRLLVERAGAVFGLQIALQHFLDVLPDMQRIENLHVGEALEEDDAHRELVGVLHLLDGLLAPFLGEIAQAPIVEQTVMDPV